MTLASRLYFLVSTNLFMPQIILTIIVDAQDEISIADTLKTLCFLAEYKGEIKVPCWPPCL